MKTKKGKVLSWLMVCAMVVSLIPMMGIPAYAETGSRILEEANQFFDSGTGAMNGSLSVNVSLNSTDSSSIAGWRHDNVGWRYQDEDGNCPKSVWKKIGGKWYHFDENGYMQTGWLKLGKTWYYLKSNGAMATGWLKVGSSWYYLKPSGAMAIGWLKSGSTWYYLKPGGAMATGWLKVGSYWYYFNSSGSMAQDTWIGNYYVNSSGRWVKDAVKKLTVSFETNGGGEISDQIVEQGQTVTKPEDPFRENAMFAGWYSDAELTASYDFGQAVTENLILYAKWVEKNEERSFTDNLIDQMPKDKNWTVSPYSLEMCLAMLANGAKGKTRDELLEALQISDLDSYNSEVKQLLETYESFNSVMSLETANSIWINQDRFGGKGSFLKSFRDVLSLNYLAEAREVWDANSVEEVNAWADEKTHGKIPQILDEEYRQFAVALANAVYFKATWQNKFSKEETKPQTFYNLDGTETETQFMSQTNEFAYYKEEGIQAVKLPYQNYLAEETGGMNVKVFKDANFSMYLLLSEEELNVQDVLDHAKFQRAKVHLTVPKFKMEYGDELRDELEALGIHLAFNPGLADLTGMVDTTDCPWMNSLYLDEVLQKAYLSIDEDGTEAAAVTVAVTKETVSLDPPLIYDFTADHPFYFVIRDNTSGRILFAGKYNSVSD